MLSLITGWSLGVLLGARHALEPDHLAAVSTLVAERPTTRGAALLGAAWGLGHTSALLLAGGLLLALRTRMPTLLADLFELLVAIMLLALGARALRRRCQTRPLDTYSTPRSSRVNYLKQIKKTSMRPILLRPPGAGKGVRPAHLTLSDTSPSSSTSIRFYYAKKCHVGGSDTSATSPMYRPLLVGLVHGLAGSGALTALVLASMPTALSALVYLVLFGAGSLAGMALLTGVVGLSLRRVAATARVQAVLVSVGGAASVVLGVALGVPLALRLLGS